MLGRCVNYSLPVLVIKFLNHQIKVEIPRLSSNITCDNDGFSQLTLTWSTPGVNMSVTQIIRRKHYQREG